MIGIERIYNLKKLIFTAVIIVLIASGSFALTWQETLKISEANSNDINSAKKQLDVSQWSYLKAYSPFLPQVSANMSSSQSLDPSNTTKNYSYGLSATQTLFKGFSNYFNLQSAYVNYQLDDVGLKKAESDFFYGIRTAYLTLLTAQKNIDVQKAILAERKENARMIKLLYDSGTEDKGNYLQTQAQVKEAEFNLASASRDYSLAQFRFAQLAGLDVSSAESISAEVVSDATVENTSDIYGLLEVAPAYLSAKYQLDLADISKKATVGEFLPSISLSANYQRTGNNWPPDNSSKSLTLGASYSLFPGGANIADAVINFAQYDKASQDYEKSKKDSLYNIKSAYEGLKNAIDAYAVQKVYLNATSERAKISQAQYLNGLISYNDWNIIQGDYINYQRTVLSYWKAALVAEAAFYNSYGGWDK